MNDEDQKTVVMIPENLLVECPLTGGSLRSLRVCAGCEHHRGLTPARFPGRVAVTVEKDFALQHQIACGYPIARRILRLELADKKEVNHGSA